MNTRAVFTIMLVFFVGFVGVVFMVQKANAPVIREIQENQLMVLDALAQMERQSGGAEGGVGIGPSARLDARLASLERKVDKILAIFEDVAKRDSAQAQRPPSEDFDKEYEIPLDGSPILGRKDAPITIVEFMDFQCPYCARFHPTLLEVYNAYPDKVKLVMKNFPLSFHKQARPAARAAMAAGEQGKYWEMADMLLLNFRNLSDEAIEGYAEKVGLDMKKFRKDLEERQDEWDAIIAADQELGQKVDVRGTPSFYLNGRKTQARTLEAYKAEIDKILAQ